MRASGCSVPYYICHICHYLLMLPLLGLRIAESTALNKRERFLNDLNTHTISPQIEASVMSRAIIGCN